MSEFHYVRTRGTDGGVDACEGPAIGLDLETVLKDGLPPWNIALEVVAALCEILDIADEDGEVHGEVHPKFVFIDETGAVSLEGFGVKRRKTRAPEGVAKDTRTDLYGLGYTTYRCFCSHPLPETVPTDAGEHDEMIVDAALEIDLSGVPNEMQGDLQWYVAKLMEFQPSERPTALEAWRTFVAFANGSVGVDMAEWCASALDGGGVRRTENARDASGAPAPEPEPPEDEELGGPVVLKGPLKGKLPFDESAAAAAAASAKAGATAFWTKAEMKKALERADDDPEDRTLRDSSLPPSGPSITSAMPMRGGRPQAGGGAATAFWSQSELDAMARGDQNAPRPRRVEGEGERRRGVTAAQTLSPGTAAGTRPPPSRAPGSGEAPRGVGPRTAAPRPAGPPAKPESESGDLTVPAPGRSPSDPPLTAPSKAPSKAPVTRFEPGKPPAPPPVARTVTPEPGPPSARVSNAAQNLDPANRAGFDPANRPKLDPANRPDASSYAGDPTVRMKPRPPPTPPAAAPPPPEEGGGLKFVLFGGGIAAAGVIAAGVVVLLLLVLVVIVTWPKSAAVEVPVVSPTPVTVEEPAIDGGAGAAEVPGEVPTPTPAVTPEPPPKPTPTAKPTPKPTPKPAPPKPAAPKPAAPKPAAPAPAKPVPAVSPPAPPKPVPAEPVPSPRPQKGHQPSSEGSAKVTIKSVAGGSVSGCSGGKVDFVGTRAFTIEGYLLPATCLVTIDGARGVFQVYGSGEVTCDKQGTVVVCDKQQVP